MMPRSALMALVGGTHVLVGLLFLFAYTSATQLFVVDPAPQAMLLVRGLGGILIAFGMLNLMARHGTEPRLLRAVLVGTLLYLVSTTAFDMHYALAGLLRPAAWTTIAIRLLFASTYAWELWRLRRG